MFRFSVAMTLGICFMVFYPLTFSHDLAAGQAIDRPNRKKRNKGVDSPIF